ARHLDHLWRKVDAVDGFEDIAQGFGHKAGAAADVERGVETAARSKLVDDAAHQRGYGVAEPADEVAVEDAGIVVEQIGSVGVARPRSAVLKGGEHVGGEPVVRPQLQRHAEALAGIVPVTRIKLGLAQKGEYFGRIG